MRVTINYNGKFNGLTQALLKVACQWHRNLNGESLQDVFVQIPKGVTSSTVRKKLNDIASRHDIQIEFKPKWIWPEGQMMFRFLYAPLYLTNEWDKPDSPKPPKQKQPTQPRIPGNYKAGSKNEFYYQQLIAGGQKGRWVTVRLRDGDDVKLARFAISKLCRAHGHSMKTTIEANGDLMFLLVD